MKLLTFAHRGEAQHFLKEGNYTSLPFIFDGAYRNSDSFLLITGEGLKNASEKTAAFCGAFSDEIKEVFNIGVAGALSPSIELGVIYSIRSSYAEDQFKSYSSLESASKIDCISSHKRVFDIKEAAHLECFANLVDRELWSIGAIATLFKVPFHAIKLASDRVGENSEICQVIKDQAPEFSARLYDFFIQNFSNEKIMPPTDLLLVDDKRFYLTTSQLRKYQSLLTSLSQKLQNNERKILAKINLEQICEDNTRPKQRSNALLLLMHELLNPFQKQVRDKLDSLLSDYTSNNIHIKFDENYEGDNFYLSTKVQSPEDLELVIKKLQSFPYPKIKNLFRGDLDV
jgi:hypothetical protein